MKNNIDYVAKVINSFLKERVSFDYDGTITRKDIQDKIKEMISSNKYEIYIISARDSKAGMNAMAMRLGIKLQNVFATGSNENKIEKVKSLLIKKHYDNNPDVVRKLPYIGEKV
jgi:hydroxymethylpyrimidine pyrophosphatase-like HAD family hydrolase